MRLHASSCTYGAARLRLLLPRVPLGKLPGPIVRREGVEVVALLLCLGSSLPPDLDLAAFLEGAGIVHVHLLLRSFPRRAHVDRDRTRRVVPVPGPRVGTAPAGPQTAENSPESSLPLSRHPPSQSCPLIPSPPSPLLKTLHPRELFPHRHTKKPNYNTCLLRASHSRAPSKSRQIRGRSIEDVSAAAAQGSRVGRPGRPGGGARGPAAVPDDAGEPAAALGVRPQGVHHPLHPDAAHHRRRLRRRLRAPRRALLRLLARRVRPLHLPHHPPIHRAVSSVLLLPAAPGEPAAAGALHAGHQLRGGPHLRVHQGGGDPGVGDPHGGRGGQPHGVHVLGGQARPRLQLPRPLPLRRRHDPHGLRAHPALLPARPHLPHDLRRARCARLLRIHHLRYRQPHQALLLRRVRLGRRRALPRRHQPLPLPPHPLQGSRFLKCVLAFPPWRRHQSFPAIYRMCFACVCAAAACHPSVNYFLLIFDLLYMVCYI